MSKRVIRMWDGAAIAALRQGYADPTITRREVANRLDRSLSSVEQQAHRLKLTKAGNMAKPQPPPPKPAATAPRIVDWQAHAAELRRRGIGEATVAAMLAQVGIR